MTYLYLHGFFVAFARKNEPKGLSFNEGVDQASGVEEETFDVPNQVNVIAIVLRIEVGSYDHLN